MAAEDVDLVVLLGDYIYEDVNPRTPFIASALDEVHPLGECMTLSDYRTRYAFYKRDAQLQ